jgi:CIC family chloride channel protein
VNKTVEPGKRVLRERLEALLAALGESSPFILLAAAIVGLAGGLAAILFRALIEAATWLFSGGAAVTPEGFAALPRWWIVLMPAAGGLAVAPITRWLAPEVRGTGVPEVMEAVALRGARVRKRVALLKALAVAACLGSGGSAGREGPIVHVGAALGSLVGRVLRMRVGQLRTFVGCGAAAGIAATFNAPIAGAMFAGEVILGQFGVRSFSAIVIASVVATVLSRHYIGDFPAFEVPSFALVTPTELVYYAGLGLLAAGLGALFIVTRQAIGKQFDAMRLPELLKPALGGLGLGALALLFPQLLGVGYAGINGAMQGALSWELMLGLAPLKLLATALTLGSGGSGGIFAPSLFVGAMTGGAGGSLLRRTMGSAVGSPGSYALVTMGALVAATTRAPITAIIIIFELTNNYTIILPLMTACILAAIVAGYLVRPSIYEVQLLSRGIDLQQRSHTNLLRRIAVADARLDQPPRVREDTPLSELIKIGPERQALHYLVEDRDGQYLGLIHLSELRQRLFAIERPSDAVCAGELANRAVPLIAPNETLDLALRLLARADLDALPVSDPDDPERVMGLLSEDGVLNAYQDELRKCDVASETGALVVTTERAGVVKLGQRTMLCEMEAPSHFVGKRLRDLQLTNRFAVQVVLIRHLRGDANEPLREMPGPDYQICEGDTLLLIGERAGLQQIGALR